MEIFLHSFSVCKCIHAAQDCLNTIEQQRNTRWMKIKSGMCLNWIQYWQEAFCGAHPKRTCAEFSLARPVKYTHLCVKKKKKNYHYIRSIYMVLKWQQPHISMSLMIIKQPKTQRKRKSIIDFEKPCFRIQVIVITWLIWKNVSIQGTLKETILDN